MKIYLFLFTLLLSSVTSFAQDDFMIGKWGFEKIPNHLEIDEEGKKMMNKFFKGMTVSFNTKNYSLFMMGASENGTWTKSGEGSYILESSKGAQTTVELKTVSETQMIFSLDKKQEFQLIKLDNKPDIEIVENSLDKVEGLEIVSNDLLGVWYHNGSIKDGKDSGLIFKHSDNELLNYSFKKNGKFINKSLFGVTLKATWSIDAEKNILVIKSDELTEFLKVVKLDENELHLYKPANESVIKFKK